MWILTFVLKEYKMFKGYNLHSFFKSFETEEQCKDYLYDLKWKNGFVCYRCSHTNGCPSAAYATIKCNRCKHIHSATAQTLFHKCKFPLQSAFLMVFLIATSKKGVSSYDLSRRTGIRRTTCYYFKRKVMKAMEQDEDDKLNGKVDVDESSFGGPNPGKRGRSKAKTKKEFVIAIEMKKGKVVKARAQFITKASTGQIKPFFYKFINKEACVRSDKWKAYDAISLEYKNMIQQESQPPKNFKLLHREIMLLKLSIRGMYHSIQHTQEYLNEYYWRRGVTDKSTLFQTLICNMLNLKPIQIKQLSLG